MSAFASIKQFCNPNALCGFFLTLGIAFAYIFFGFPNGFILGTSSYWLMETQDVTQYAAGFMAFFQEPLHLPLLRIESLNWPEGTLATFVDVIPLYALTLKLFLPKSLAPFNPFGFWIGLCLLLQAIGAWWALREACVKKWSALCALVCLLLTLPILQHRLGHVSLFSQWILVFSICLTLRSERLGRTSAGWCILVVCAMYINVYLTAMSALLYGVDLWRHRTKPNFASWARWPLITLSLVAITLPIMIWPLPGHHLAQDEGFGIYSMNLLAPITGSRFFSLTTPTASDPQAVEGFNYLGLGLILLLGWLWMGRNTYSQKLGRSDSILVKPSALWGLLVLLTIYALSNKVYFGNLQILEWPLPDFAKGITGSFRASGRFFWPVVYIATIFGVIASARCLDGWRLFILLSVVTALQVADRWIGIQALYGKGLPTQTFKLNKHEWQDALGNTTDTIYFYPKMRCAKSSSFYDTLLPTMRFAAERGIKINTGYIARYAPDCAAMSEESRASDPTHSAYVFVNAEYSAEAISSSLPAAPVWRCEAVDFATICTIDHTGKTQ